MTKELENKYKIALGENIRKIRKRFKLTQDNFSEIIGIEPSSLSNIENGKSFPSAFTIIQIQEKLKVKAEEIFDIDILNNATLDEDIQIKLQKLDIDKKKILWKFINSLDY
ncbi:MAG: helix-turn-helix transcriptional regulator [Cyanobacteria bacterium SIG27]|nr:helix-turn-helix transcriptional regulator [Cyanobacteria bacterium SIG27]